MKLKALPPLNLNLKSKELAEALIEILDLSQYQKETLKILLACPRPVLATEIHHHTDKVSRTKIYGVLKVLVKSGLVKVLKVTEDDYDKPYIYEYWPEKTQNRYDIEHFNNISFYKANTEYLKDLYYTWSTEFFIRKNKISSLIEILEQQEPAKIITEENVILVP